MPAYAPARSQPIVLSASTEAQVYALFALAMGLTVFGVFLGMQFALPLFSSGLVWLLLIAELGIVFSARLWIAQTPLNYLLFGLFPVLSGITVTPFLLSVLVGYANGGSILLNALAATGCMAGASAVFARTTRWDLSMFSRALFLGIIGLLALGLLQIFFPALRTTPFELMLSGGGVLLFAAFTAFDLQRIQAMGRMGENAFLLALSLYLDIFNLFLYVVRFMIAISGERR